MAKFAIMNLTCYIIDDESHAIAILKDFVQKTLGLELAGSAEDPVSALQEISLLRPDVTFLDVDMPELNGLKFASMVKSQTIVIFTTAYREYAVEAFEAEAADYLLKPISYERFLASIQKVRNKHIDFLKSGDKPMSSFFVKSGTKDKLLRVDIENILYVSGFDHYVEIYFKEQKIVTYLKLSDILTKLPPGRFSQIHRSHIINLRAIQSIEPGQVKLSNETILPIGPTYRDAFRKALSDAKFMF